MSEYQQHAVDWPAAGAVAPLAPDRAFVVQFRASAPFAGRVEHMTKVNAHLMVAALRYGLTDDWDVSLAVPIVDAFLRVRNDVVPVVDVDPSFARFLFARNDQGNQTFLGYRDASGNPINDFSRLPLRKTQYAPMKLAKAAGSATGVGDISLRTKYRLWDNNGLGGAALGFNLQLPTGEKKNFHGTGETHLSSFVYLSQIINERIEPHVNLGVDFNANDVGRSSFLYAVGASALLWKNLGVIVDFIGRNEFGRLSARVPDEGIFKQGFLLNRAPEGCTTAQPCAITARTAATPIAFPFFPGKLRRNNSADFSVGLRYLLGTSGSVFVSGLVPLNDNGFRSDFIPSMGIEYTF